MKVIILAGGKGTRLRPQTNNIPKALVKIGKHPIIWHIMKYYSYFGFKKFIVCLGYKGKALRDYFLNYIYRFSDFTIDLKSSDIQFHKKTNEDWKVTLIDKGLETTKGGRIKKIEKYLDSDINLLTYADGLCDVNVKELVDFHKNHKRILTITGVSPNSKYGKIVEKDGKAINFEEKKRDSLVNGGFMVFNKKLLNYIDLDSDLERDVFDYLVNIGELMVYKHNGDWKCMDTEKDYIKLNELWNNKEAFWRIW